MIKKTLKILIVDDNRADINIFIRHLKSIERWEFDIHFSLDADSALEQISGGGFQIIFLDFKLPRMSGLDFLKKFRTVDNKCPVVILTGQGNERIATEIFRHGGNDYFLKEDLSAQTLEDCILRILSSQVAQLIEEMKHKEQMDKVKDSFFEMITHEMRTPLNSVLGMAQTGIRFSNKGKLTLEKSTELFQTILTSGELLKKIIDDVLDLARIESGKFDIKIEKIHLHQLFDALDASLFQLARDKGLEMHISIPETFPHVLVDSNRLTQVLYNLIGNAIKFTNQGSVQITVEDIKEKGFVVVAIKDTGIGIPKDKIKQIFERFTQIDSSGKLEGTGLGLNICQQLVKLMGGSIWVESEEGQESIFFIKLKTEE